MLRCLLFLLLVMLAGPPGLVFAADDGPPISITSPDAGTTFALGTVKHRSLYWDKKDKVLIAKITFTDEEQNLGQSNEDTHEFRLPGVSFDEAKGIFFATSAKGEMIPVAHFKKVLFIKSIEPTANAIVHIIHPKGGNVTVILEAISPNDPAMHQAPTDPDATHKVDIDKVL